MIATVAETSKGIYQVSVADLLLRLPIDGFFWLDVDGASAEELQSITTVFHTSRRVCGSLASDNGSDLRWIGSKPGYLPGESELPESQ
jgi:hypothetical protein